MILLEKKKTEKRGPKIQDKVMEERQQEEINIQSSNWFIGVAIGKLLATKYCPIH